MIKTGTELASACVNVATNYKTLYILGGIGGPLNAANKQRAKNSYAYNRNTQRATKINMATADTFGFDCVCLVKSLLWGWNGDVNKNYGGASYKSNGVPDVAVDGLLNVCSGVSDDFTSIAIGEYLWMKGHCGIYVGNGLAVECTPIWADGVQITAVHNIGTKAGYKGRKWAKHGKLPYVTYEQPEAPKQTSGEYALVMRILGRNAKGEDVRAVQRLLIAGGYSCGKYADDGDFGSATEKAVRSFQRDRAMEQSGVVEEKTMYGLLGVKK